MSNITKLRAIANTTSSKATGHMQVCAPNESELDYLVSIFPGGRPSVIRLVKFLAKTPHSSTVEVNRACAIGNISQEATAANKRLFSKGYMVGCMRPPVPLTNRFEQKTGQHLWSLYALPEEALNDSDY